MSYNKYVSRERRSESHPTERNPPMMTAAELTDLEIADNEARFSPTSGDTDTGRSQPPFELGFIPEEEIGLLAGMMEDEEDPFAEDGLLLAA